MKRTALAVVIAVLAPALALYGWGQKGHRIVADIAQERLTEVTKRSVQSLIGNNTLVSVRTAVCSRLTRAGVTSCENAAIAIG